jgi:FAD/FMN-containing dehydrogenase
LDFHINRFLTDVELLPVSVFDEVNEYGIDEIMSDTSSRPIVHSLPNQFLSQISSTFPQDFISFAPEILEVYGKDWTKVFPSRPTAVVFPRTTDEVSRILKLCSEHGLAVVPSGGRTGLAGGAVASRGEVVLSLDRMKRMDSVDTLAQTVRVQAGAVTEAVHQHCAVHGLTWPVDFASKGSSHVGGNIATNAGGVKVIRYGLTRNWVLGLEVVTMNGEILQLNGGLEKNNTGLDLRQIFIGSEGTLGVITEAVLKLTRIAGLLDVFFFAVESISDVLRLFHAARRAPFQISAFEFLTRNCMESVIRARGLNSPFKQFYPTYVLFEVERPLSPDAQKILDQWLEELFEMGLVLDGTLAQSPREAKDLWSLREGIAESLAHQGFMHKNDISLPISNLEPFIAEMYPIFSKRDAALEIFLFGHIGDGNLHVNTMKPAEMDRNHFIQTCHQTDEELFALVKKYDGSVSAEHGIGLLKKAALKFSRTESELMMMRGIKQVLDPQGLLNPGKIFD